jgi:hypothetical protein
MTTSPAGATQVYMRDCFACGNPMELAAKGSHTLICRPCEVTENGTIQGRFPRSGNVSGMWGSEMIPYLDHGETIAPSPDTMGYREPVPLAEQASSRQDDGVSRPQSREDHP